MSVRSLFARRRPPQRKIATFRARILLMQRVIRTDLRVRAQRRATLSRLWASIETRALELAARRRTRNDVRECAAHRKVAVALERSSGGAVGARAAATAAAASAVRGGGGDGGASRPPKPLWRASGCAISGDGPDGKGTRNNACTIDPTIDPAVREAFISKLLADARADFKRRQGENKQRLLEVGYSRTGGSRVGVVACAAEKGVRRAGPPPSLP